MCEYSVGVRTIVDIFLGVNICAVDGVVIELIQSLNNVLHLLFLCSL